MKLIAGAGTEIGAYRGKKDGGGRNASRLLNLTSSNIYENNRRNIVLHMWYC